MLNVELQAMAWLPIFFMVAISFSLELGQLVFALLETIATNVERAGAIRKHAVR